MRTVLFIILFGTFLTSCTKERLTGNGEIVTDTRSISGFTGIHSSGSNRLFVNHGPEFKVEVKGSSNLVPRYKTIVRNNTLELGYENRLNIHGDDIQVFVTLPAIKNVSLSGSGKVRISGNFPATQLFRLSISGSADVDVMDEFQCNSLSTSISGSGNANLLPILAQDADVTISGSGDVRVSAEQKLKVKISGSGDVFYSGSPEVSANISGSGQVRKI